MSKHKYAVIGLGAFGSTVALELERLGNEVLGIDKDEPRVNRIASQLSHAVVADVRDERVFQELGLADYDAVVVAIGEDLEANVLCTLALKSLGVQSLWVKALSPVHHRILEKLGADRIINPEHHVGVHLARTIIYPNVLDYISLGEEEYIVEVVVPDALAGKPIGALELPQRYGVQVLAFKRDGSATSVGELAERVLQRGDRLVLFGTLGNLRRVGRERL